MLWELLQRLLPYLFLMNISWAPIRFPELDLARIFSSGNFLARAAEERLVTLMVTGDVLPGRSVHLRYTQTGDPNYAFAETAEVLRGADITFINLEGPLVADCPVFYTGFTFCGDPRFAEGLKFAGADVINVANNHIYNFGAGGLSQTLETLRRNGLLPAGEGNIAYLTVKGTRFAFLGYNAVGKVLDRSAAAEEIKTAKANADVVVVQFHWGQEYTYLPKRAGSEPVELGHLAIDAGADLVVSNHPHWIQGTEIYRGKVITYSHGNFVFDQMFSEETRAGVVGKYTFYGRKLVGVEFLPTKIYRSFQPQFLKGEEAQAVLDKMQRSSEMIRELVK
uniref:CapA family protein n=1 Tax=candidate division WWE3 bacterium TaxID=2053526 RepID=A0A831YT26_UNCKA